MVWDMNEYLINLIREWVKNKKTGKLVINFFRGTVVSANKEETIKLTDKNGHELR